jgi:hypothetical protein
MSKLLTKVTKALTEKKKKKNKGQPLFKEMAKAPQHESFLRAKFFDPFIHFENIYFEPPNIMRLDELSEGVEKFLEPYPLLKEYSSFFMGYESPSYGDLQTEPDFMFAPRTRCELREVGHKVWAFVGYRDPCVVEFYYANESKAAAYEIIEEVQRKFEYFKETVHKNKIYLLYRNQGGFYLKDHEISKDFICDISLNYGDDFVPIYQRLMGSLEKETNGLYIMASAPGLGKTSLMKYLIQNLSTQKILFIQPGMSHCLGDAEFLPFLTNQNIQIIFIEDAENALRSREETGSNGVSTILNMSDGILGDILKIKIFATMNSGKDSIDSALLRPGRLKFFHEFKPLKANEADRLLVKLGREPMGKAMTLAEIYNPEETGVKKKVERSMNIFGNG